MKEPSGNGYVPIIAQAIEEMKAEWGDTFSLEQINLAELERRTGISRGKLRRLKKNGFQDSRRNGDSGKHKITKLTGYSGIIDTLLKQGVSNSTVILNRLQESGFEGKLTIVKDYIAAHKYLLPAKRQQVAPQGNRGRRYIRNEIKAQIIRAGMTMQEVVDLLSDEYGWSDSVSNLSAKLQRESIRYKEVLELADVLGYDIVWQQRREK